MVGEEELHLKALAAPHLSRTRMNAHAGLDLRVAGGDDVVSAVRPLDPDETDAAGSGTVVEGRKFAERRDEDPGTAGRLKNRVVGLDHHGDAVDECAGRELLLVFINLGSHLGETPSKGKRVLARGLGAGNGVAGRHADEAVAAHAAL